MCDYLTFIAQVYTSILIRVLLFNLVFIIIFFINIVKFTKILLGYKFLLTFAKMFFIISLIINCVIIELILSLP